MMLRMRLDSYLPPAAFILLACVLPLAGCSLFGFGSLSGLEGIMGFDDFGPFVPEPRPASTPPTVTGIGGDAWSTDGGPLTLHGYVGVPGGNEPVWVSYDGSEATAYAWDFGSGADPATSTAASPLLAFHGPGSFPASVTVANAFGSDTLDFVVSTIMPPRPDLFAPSLQDLSGHETSVLTSGQQYRIYGSDYQLYDWQARGFPTERWVFSLGAGSDPPQVGLVENYQTPFVVVTAAAPGAYHGTVTATNAAGMDSVEFDYTVIAP